MDRERFLDEVTRRAGLDTSAQARRTSEAVLSVLGSLLPDLALRAVAADLPPELRAPVRSAEASEDFEAPELYRRVAQLEEVSEGFAAEHAQVVCQVLAEAVGGEAWAHLVKHLPPSVAALCQPRESVPPPPAHPHPHPVRGHKLSDGRPGSEHPVSETDRTPAHRGSVARSDNPHGATKLSSTRGVSAERRADTLSRGRPRRRHPLHDRRGKRDRD